MIVLNGRQISKMYVHLRMGPKVWRIRNEEWPRLQKILGHFDARSYEAELIKRDLKELKRGKD